MAPIIAALTALSAVITATLAVPLSVALSSSIDPECRTSENLSRLQKEMPTLAGLPSNENATLKYVAVGVGSQNYTCNGTAYVQTESGDGALAFLYDATQSFILNSEAIQTMPAQRLKEYENDGENQALTDLDPPLAELGEHFFNTALQPNFNLYGAQPPLYLLAKKIDSVASPTSGDISWLYLENAGLGETEGLNSVYRVQTAGGVAPETCSNPGETLDVPYSAEYWFFD